MLDIQSLTDKEIDNKIADLKVKFGDDLFIPAHHYQKDEITQFADYTGDSLQLARISAETKSKYIVFCGVYFMAEIARVLASSDKRVFIPDTNAGCPLADFAIIDDIEKNWKILNSFYNDKFIPVTYANSYANVKAFCGRNNGLVCTSSNVKQVFFWILKQNKKVFFMPDKNLAINTAHSIDLNDDYYIIKRHNDVTREELANKRIIIWDGFCIVHKVFNVDHVNYWKNKDKDIKIIVHPECNPDVVAASDYAGSTSKIKSTIENSEKGSKWVVGTEFNFVQRLKNNNPDKLIEPLDKSVCANMSRITRRKLLSTLLAIDNNDYSKQIIVAEQEVDEAKKSIEKMLEIG